MTVLAFHYTELTWLNPFEIQKPNGQALQKLWMRGGFPDSYRAKDDQSSQAWRQNFIRTYAERETPQLRHQLFSSAPRQVPKLTW